MAEITIANSIPTLHCEYLYQQLQRNAVQCMDCVFPNLLLEKGYPRYTLNKTDRAIFLGELEPKAQDETVEAFQSRAKEFVTAHKEELKWPKKKQRIPYHHIAWRSLGQIILKGSDVSHICRRGEMQSNYVPAHQKNQTSWTCSQVFMGCFSRTCLEQVPHQDNLERSRCIPVTRCRYCTLHTVQCCHTPHCGSKFIATDEELSRQKPVKSIVITYTDGSQETIDAPIAEDDESESSDDLGEAWSLNVKQ